MKSFYMPPGYHIELVASDPLIQDPIKMEFDGDGRLWVLEMQGWASVGGEAMTNSLEPINDLAILEDTDGDGVYDKKTIFLDKLILPRAFKILDHNCALVGEPPHLWKACDTNGDLKADTKVEVSNTFATQGVVEHGANGLFWAMDNWIYVSEHNWDLHQKDNKYTVVPSLSRGQWGLTQDDAGRLFRDVNTDPLYVDYTAPRYFMRNPNATRTTGLYFNLVDQETTLVWPVRQTLGVNRGYREEVPRPDGSSYYYQGVSNPMIFRGDALPKEIQGQPFVVDGPTNIVHLLKLADDNGKLSAKDYYPKGEFLASTDERFRPVDLQLGWDGTLYIVDMYRGVSQDGPIQTDYLRDYIKKRKLWEGIHYGRIYRVVHDTSKFDAKPHMIEETPAQLVAHLSSTNGWSRDVAQQLLIQRNDKSTVPAIKTLATKSPDWRFRIQAMATLDGMDSIDAATVTTALDDKSPDVRAEALRLSERWLGQAGNPIQAAVLKKIDDPSWTVRHQVAASLGEMPKDARLAPIVTVMQKYGDDDVTVDAAVSSLNGQEADALAKLLDSPGVVSRVVPPTRKGPGVAGGRAGTVVPGLETVDANALTPSQAQDMAKPEADPISQLAAAVARSHDGPSMERIISFAVDTKKPEALRYAILRGAFVGLPGAGGRGGGGGFGGGGGGGGGGRGRGGAAAAGPVALKAEPATLIADSKQTDDIGIAAQRVIAGVTWPGKPTPPVVRQTRTPEQQARFDAGEKIYATECIGCHQDQGQGAEHVGAALAGSRFVNGQAATLVRIMTAGKEGAIGLMPPAGSQMNDEQLASILTFVRGSFGNNAAAVQPAEVKETRLMYSYRKTPWTEPELAAGRGGRGGGGGGN